MKIAHFTDSSLFIMSGLANSLINLSNGLQENGHKITIFAPKTSKKQRRVRFKGVKLILFPSIASPWEPRLRISLPLSPSLFRKTRMIRPDIIHFHTPFVVSGTSIILGKLLKIPVVATFHSYFMQSEYLKTVGINGQTTALTNFLWKYVVLFYNQCDAVIAPSKSVKLDLEKHGVIKPIYLISNLVDQTKFKEVSKNELKKLKSRYKLNDKVLLYVGRFSHEKSLDVLLKSFAKVSKVIKNVSLLLIGDGQIKPELKSLVKTLGIRDKVAFAGLIAQKTLLSAGYFQLADVFVTASGSETQGIALIEAMYFGVPLVGISKKGTFDMIKKVGLLSRPKDTNGLAKNILRVINDESLQKKLSKASRKSFLKKYTAKKIVAQFENLYKQLSKRG